MNVHSSLELCAQVRAGVGVDLIGQCTLDVLMFTLGYLLFDLTPLGAASLVAFGAANTSTLAVASNANATSALSFLLSDATAGTHMLQ